MACPVHIMQDDELCLLCVSYMLSGERLKNDSLRADLARVTTENEKLREALWWVLPMAKGYAHIHPVGRNQGIVDHAVEVLDKQDAAARALESSKT